MEEEQTVKENQAKEPVKKSFIIRPKEELQSMYEQKSSGKKFLIIIMVLILFLAGGYFVIRRDTKSVPPVATPAPVLPTPTAVIEPVLNRSDWSLEILNGSGVTGAAKKLADKIQVLGYPVVKTGNADKDNYALSQILVKKSLQDQIKLIIADLKDIIKIASVSGELKEGTASARIIIGKDSI